MVVVKGLGIRAGARFNGMAGILEPLLLARHHVRRVVEAAAASDMTLKRGRRIRPPKFFLGKKIQRC